MADIIVKKSFLALAVLAVSSAVCAQGQADLGREEMLAVFQEYNPAALDKAGQNEVYADILNQLTAAYTASRTAENYYDLVALVKNFDNSIALHIIGQSYLKQITLQEMSGQEFPSLEQDTLETLKPVMRRILDNTVSVRKLQIADYKKQLKQISRNGELSAQQKAQQKAQVKEQIRLLKQEIHELKHHTNRYIEETAKGYLVQVKEQQAASQAQALEAAQSASHDVKANHKKPVAQ